jgi:hypothetical protein
MTERWDRPVIPIALEPVDQGIYLADGRRLGVLAPVLSPEDIERARLGYVCLKCLQWFEEAWPEKCFVCGAHIRRDQAEYFAREFGGEVQLGPSTSLDDELAALREKEEPNGS